jgi:hypothetical protein
MYWTTQISQLFGLQKFKYLDGKEMHVDIYDYSFKTEKSKDCQYIYMIVDYTFLIKSQIYKKNLLILLGL